MMPTPQSGCEAEGESQQETSNANHMTPLAARTQLAGPSLTNANSSQGARRSSSIYLLALLGMLFLAAPFLDDLPGGDLLETVLLTGVMLCSVFAVGGRSRSLA